MNKITLNDINLSAYNLDTFPRLKKIRDNLLSTTSKICIERSKYITEYLKKTEHENEPIQIRRAGAVHHFLSKKKPLFFDDNLLAGTTCSNPYGAPVYPELSALLIWPELDTISTRKKNPQKLSKEDKKTLNLEIFPYWMNKNILEYTRNKYNNPDSIKLFESFVFFITSKTGCISHTVPYYKTAIEKGIRYIIEDAKQKEFTISKKKNISAEDISKKNFYTSVQTALEGIILYANNLSINARQLARQEKDPVRKKNYEQMAEICAQVPAKPARTFREAVNALWLIQIAIHAENINMAISPGRLDQILFKYYQEDIKNGSLNIEEAMEITGCLWLKFNDNTNLVPEVAEKLYGGAGTVPAITLGGVTPDGKDATNDLTYIMLRITEILKLRDPNVNARFHYKTNNQEYRNRVANVISNTRAIPAIHNDVTDIKVLTNQGIKIKDARDYAIIGCVELAVAGKSYDASSSIMLNLVSILELTLYNGKRPITGEKQVGPITGNYLDFNSYSDFWEAFKKQFEFLTGKAIELNEMLGLTHQEIYPSPLLSAFFKGPLKKGKDLIHGGALYNSSGATHIGFADTVDSLNAIEKAVFVDKKFSLKEIINALDADFKRYEKLHAYLINKTPKYGTEDPIALKNSNNLIKFLYNFYSQHTNYRGGKYYPAYWTMTNHAGHGKMTAALPNGRKSGKVFSSGITPCTGSTNNITQCFRTVSSLDPLCIPGGFALNLKYPEIKDHNDQLKFAQAIEAYFNYGGMHVQFNIFSYETAYNIKDGKPVQFPSEYKNILPFY